MSDQFTIHNGRDKEPEAEDPLELIGARVSGGDPELMATCMIEEYARLGMGEEEILELFRRPVYQIHALYQQYGEGWIRNLIRNVLARTGRLHVTLTVLHHIGGDDA